MKRSFWTRLFCLTLVFSLLILPGCGVGDDAGGGNGANFEKWDDSKGTVTTEKLDDGGKKVEKKDLDGKLVQKEYYNEEGKLDHYFTYEYDTNGNILREQKKGSKHTVWETTAYVYEGGKLKSKQTLNEKDIVTEEEFYLSDGTVDQIRKYKYDDNGNVINIRYYDSTHTFLGCADQIYDDTGRMIQRVEMDYLEIPKRTYDYYEDGSKDETVGVLLDNGYLGEYRKLVTRIDPSGKRLYTTGYNGRDEKVTYTEYNADGSGTTWTYFVGYENVPSETVQYETIFDKDNQLIKETYYYMGTGRIISIKEGVFDENGKLTSKIEHAWWPSGELEYVIVYSPDDLALRYEFYTEEGTLDNYSTCQYDENGRLIYSDKYSGDGTYMGYYAATYYESGNIKSSRDYYADTGEIYGLDYDEEGNFTQYYEYVGTED